MDYISMIIIIDYISIIINQIVFSWAAIVTRNDFIIIITRTIILYISREETAVWGQTRKFYFLDFKYFFLMFEFLFLFFFHEDW